MITATLLAVFVRNNNENVLGWLFFSCIVDWMVAIAVAATALRWCG